MELTDIAPLDTWRELEERFRRGDDAVVLAGIGKFDARELLLKFLFDLREVRAIPQAIIRGVAEVEPHEAAREPLAPQKRETFLREAIDHRGDRRGREHADV